MTTATTPALKAPFPYFGGKSRVAAEVWRRFGDVRSYVEPFFGSGAVLLGRPQPFEGVETVNDLDGFVANFWRAVKADPGAVAEAVDYPVIEADLHARHAWLIGRRESLQAALEADPEWFDAKAAGWWAWGLSCWIGSGWCGPRISRQRPHLRDYGHGVHPLRRLRRFGDAVAALADRLRSVRVCCGDWARIVGPAAMLKAGLVGVLLDPPYGASAARDPALYAAESLTVADEVRAWCVAHDSDPRYRIALCGHDGEHDDLESRGWAAFAWSATGCSEANRGRERIWFSPSCLTPEPRT